MNIFITGGTTGIGLALTQAYLREGHQVGICGRDPEKFHQHFPSPPANLRFYAVDVVDQVKLREAMEDFSGGAAGALDLVIANAGVAMNNKKKIPDFEKAKAIFNINVNGVLNTFQTALEIMMKKKEWRQGEKRGHLVAIASVAGMVGLPGTGAYSASKAAVLKLCETFAIDLKSEGIAVTAIAPGFVDTPLTRKNRHPMPFMIGAERAAVLIKGAIKREKALYVFPFRMLIIISVLAHLPRAIYILIMRMTFARRNLYS